MTHFVDSKLLKAHRAPCLSSMLVPVRIYWRPLWGFTSAHSVKSEEGAAVSNLWQDHVLSVEPLYKLWRIKPLRNGFIPNFRLSQIKEPLRLQCVQEHRVHTDTHTRPSGPCPNGRQEGGDLGWGRGGEWDGLEVEQAPVMWHPGMMEIHVTWFQPTNQPHPKKRDGRAHTYAIHYRRSIAASASGTNTVLFLRKCGAFPKHVCLSDRI